MLTLRDRLKAATADEHDRVEAQLAAASSGASSAAYIDYLTSSYFYYAAVEPLLQENAALLAVGIDIAQAHAVHQVAQRAPHDQP